MAKGEKEEFHNTTQGYLGAVTINRKGEEVSVPVSPGDSVFLDEEEQRLTARSHRRPEGNPFVAREIISYDPATQDEIGREHRAPLERVDRERPTGAAQVGGEAATGVAASDEEVGVPDAPRRGGRSPRKRAAAVS